MNRKAENRRAETLLSMANDFMTSAIIGLFAGVAGAVAVIYYLGWFR